MKTKNHRKNLIRLSLQVAVLSLLLLPGCASKHTVTNTQSASVGQQLQDLDKSYKDGLISQKEYERLKKAIIKKND